MVARVVGRPNLTHVITVIDIEAATALNRKEYGINYNRLMDTGGAVVGDNVKINPK